MHRLFSTQLKMQTISLIRREYIDIFMGLIFFGSPCKKSKFLQMMWTSNIFSCTHLHQIFCHSIPFNFINVKTNISVLGTGSPEHLGFALIICACRYIYHLSCCLAFFLVACPWLLRVNFQTIIMTTACFLTFCITANLKRNK